MKVTNTSDPMGVDLEGFVVQGGLVPWDVVLFDLPGDSFADHGDTVVIRADLVILPLRPVGEDFDTRQQVFSKIEALGKRRGRPLDTLVLMSAVPWGKKYQKEIKKIAVDFPPNIRLLQAQLRQSVDWPDSWLQGQMPHELNSDGNAAADCQALGKEFKKELLNAATRIPQ